MELLGQNILIQVKERNEIMEIKGIKIDHVISQRELDLIGNLLEKGRTAFQCPLCNYITIISTPEEIKSKIHCLNCRKALLLDLKINKVLYKHWNPSEKYI